VAVGGFDGEAEQVADTAAIATGGSDLVEDAVGTDVPRGGAEDGPAGADRRGAVVDVQVRVAVLGQRVLR
jgi:hypothetical protein